MYLTGCFKSKVFGINITRYNNDYEIIYDIGPIIVQANHFSPNFSCLVYHYFITS